MVQQEQPSKQPQEQPIKKEVNKKLIIGVVIGIFLIIGIVIVILIITGTEKEVPGLSASVPCENVDIEFNLISCEFVKSGIFHDSTIKFKRTDNSDSTIQKVLVLVPSDKKLGFEEVSIQDFSLEQETMVSVYGIPKEVYLLITLDEQTSCRTQKISCIEKSIEEGVFGTQNQTEQLGEIGENTTGTTTTDTSTAGTEEDGMSLIGNAIEAALAGA